ncbi:uncharacterized protein A4U43_C06F350 [Asparagus officinalis]|uniref:Protein kinase domain-containing protein n=1 Tax=Asparagus officinalis TaxID=4686 RepID=A0A5P1EMF2_ASPOF|nr:uncharacterized protein A4U43_C06F350 [Asparagus officinalis]
MNSSGKVVFYSGSLERSTSSPSSFNGGPRVRARGMERSFSANVVRVSPVLNVPVCRIRGSTKSGSVFGFFSKKEKDVAAKSNGKRPSLVATTDVQLEALLAFKSSIHRDPFGSLTNWTSVTHHCNWTGISCDTLTNSVIAVTLTNMQLNGTISPFLANISTLQLIDFSSNSLFGPIPSELGLEKLKNLTFLSVGSNQLSGPIPDDLFNCSRLSTLDLRNCNFSGPLNPDIGKLSQLRNLLLSHNSFSGLIPEQVSELKQLSRLELHQNRFVGSIPDSISNLQSLSYLDLHGNVLNGSIPKSLGDLIRLLSLDLSNNLLSGSIPRPIGGLEMIQAIDLSNNNLSGSIPSAIKGCRNLHSLDFSVNRLSGQLPASIFPQLDLLTSLNLSNNKLTGSIPQNLAALTSLRQLDLSFNQFEGRVPDGGVFRYLNHSSLQGNPSLCGSKLLPSCKNVGHRFSNRALVLVITLPSLSFILLVVLVACVIYQRHRVKQKPVDGGDIKRGASFAPSIKKFTRRELENATNFFSQENMLGESSMSMVYKGRLEGSGQVVAVKKLNLVQFPAESDKCFHRELEILSQLKHKNLVKVMGYAWETGKLKALVLEFMEKGNLENIMYNSGGDWLRWTIYDRLRICISVAHALVYLHSGYDFPIVHCDLKPSNILLDQDLDAHVSDFGTSRILGVHLPDQSSNKTASMFQGTIGYIAPEFAYMRKVTTKVDVFSFGIIMMEFFTRRRPTGTIEVDGVPLTLQLYVEKAFEGGIDGVRSILDQEMELPTETEEEKAIGALELALSCTCFNVEDRPDMKQVLSTLLKLNEI